MTVLLFIKRVIIAVAKLEVKIKMGIRNFKKIKYGQSCASSYTAAHLTVLCTIHIVHQGKVTLNDLHYLLFHLNLFPTVYETYKLLSLHLQHTM